MTLKIIKRKIKRFVKFIFFIHDDSSEFIKFKNSISIRTLNEHTNIVNSAESILKYSNKIDQSDLFENSSNPVIRNGYKYRLEIMKYYFNKYDHLSNIKILIHTPTPNASMAGYSIFSNMLDSFKFLGIQAEVYGWNSKINELCEKYSPNILITCDNQSYREKIDWNYLKEYQKKNKLIIGLTASLEEYGNTSLVKRLRWAKKNNIAFYYSYRASEYLEERKEYSLFYEFGYRIVSVEFGANIKRFYPVPNFQRDLQYVFLGSINSEKWHRYFSYFPNIIKNYFGFIDGPGWNLGKSEINLDRDKFIYSRSKVGLNLHLDQQLEWCTELNERTYILAACGIPQLVDNPKLLSKRFDKDCFYVAEDPIDYFEKFRFILQNPDDSEKRVLKAQKEVFTKYTIFHRAEGFLLNLLQFIET